MARNGSRGCYTPLAEAAWFYTEKITGFPEIWCCTAGGSNPTGPATELVHIRAYRIKTTNAVVDRAYRKYMRRMVELGLVREQGAGRWKHFEVIL